MSKNKKSSEQQNINLPNGNSLNVEYNEQFIARVKNHFDLTGAPDAEHIRLFLAHALSSALNKTEV
jgi:hypothetical protein